MNTIVDKNSNILEKRPIASVLKNMEVNQTEIFPICQTMSVRTTLTQQQLYNPSIKLSTKTEKSEGIIKVTRIQ